VLGCILEALGFSNEKVQQWSACCCVLGDPRLHRETTLEHPRLVNLGSVIAAVAALYLAQVVLMPVAMAILLGFVLSPLVGRLERWRLGRVPSVLLVVLFAFCLIGLAGWFVGRQATDMVTRLPEFRSNLQSKFDLVREKLQGPLTRASGVIHEFEHGTAAPDRIDGGAPAVPTAHEEPVRKSLLELVPSGLGSLLSVLGTGGLVVLLVILILLQRSDLRDRFIALAGGGGAVVTTQALDEGTHRLSRYLLLLSVVNGLHGTAVGLGLWLIGVPNSVLWGILSAVLRFIPYVGPWIAASLPILFAFAISDGFTLPLLAIGLFVVLELVSNNVVEPLVYPKYVGVSSTALLVSAVFWTWLWGIPGLVLATPLTLCIAVMGRHVPQMRYLSIILGDQPVLSPAPRLYQRLLVKDAEDAWNLVAADLKAGKSIVEIYDAVILPALCLAQQDQHDLVIDHATYVRITESMRYLIEEASDRKGAREPVPEQSDPLRVVCVPAGKEADHVACTMLCKALRSLGANAREAPNDALVGETLGEIETSRAEVVCVSQLPPLSYSHLRYVCKRLAERFADLPILVGTWTVNLDPATIEERIQCDGRVRFFGTLAEMQGHVRQLVSPQRASAPASAPEVAGRDKQGAAKIPGSPSGTSSV
jgi:predicted PurR-regulated permease PerM